MGDLSSWRVFVACQDTIVLFYYLILTKFLYIQTSYKRGVVIIAGQKGFFKLDFFIIWWFEMVAFKMHANWNTICHKEANNGTIQT